MMPLGATMDLLESCSTVVVFITRDFKHSLLSHDIYCNSQVNERIRNCNIIDVDIYYGASRIYVLRDDDLPRHKIIQLHYDIDSRGIYCYPPCNSKAFIFNEFFVHGNILDGLKERNIDTKFSILLEVQLLLGCVLCEWLIFWDRETWLLEVQDVLSIPIYFLLEKVSEHPKELPRIKVDILNIYSISWLRGFSTIDWLRLIFVRIQVKLGRHLTLFWSIISGYLWLRRRRN